VAAGLSRGPPTMRSPHLEILGAAGSRARQISSVRPQVIPTRQTKAVFLWIVSDWRVTSGSWPGPLFRAASVPTGP
jgi:hypothetical protein